MPDLYKTGAASSNCNWSPWAEAAAGDDMIAAEPHFDLTLALLNPATSTRPWPLTGCFAT